jgi:leucyl-tRNA synthetase
VEKQGDHYVLRSDPSKRVESRAHKMSKARGNVINPDAIVQEYGADSLRMYEMFMGPLEQSKPWSMNGVSGVRGFLDRSWRMIIDASAEDVRLSPAVVDAEPAREQLVVLHKTIKAVTADIETLSFNTAIARLMEFVNFFSREEQRPRSIMEAFVLLLSPMAPHIAEELWRALGHEKTLAQEPWPVHDEELAIDNEIEIPVQVNGKVRARIQVPRGTPRESLESMARADERIQQLIGGSSIARVVVVPDRLVNFVIKA